MKIKKFGHCCLLIEENNLRILTDPGMYSNRQDEVKGIDVILITHEHQDHLHIPSLKNCLKNNPNLKVFTNKGVGKILDTEGINYSLLEDGQRTEIKGVLIEAEGHDHAHIYKTSPCINTGYFIAKRLFYPGDSLYVPNKRVEILALPIIAPWLKLSESIDYVLGIKPKIAFPVHEGILKQPEFVQKFVLKVLEPTEIKFSVIEDGKEVELN